MSIKSEVDSDGFQKVKSKRSIKSKRQELPTKSESLIKHEIVIDIDKVTRRIKSAVDELRLSCYFVNISKSVSTLVAGRKVIEVVCFGLGNISECNISKFQLALLLCLKDLCNPEKVSIHDPILYKSECQLLRQLDINIIEENTEGSYVISESDITLVFLPHCPKQLTNNFLWSNWCSNLKNCILICNSFSSLIDNQPSRILSDTVPYICKIFPYTHEISLDNNFKYTDVFNDTSVHTFPEDRLETFDHEFWSKGNKPRYENTEEFITTLMIEKLTL